MLLSQRPCYSRLSGHLRRLAEARILPAWQVGMTDRNDLKEQYRACFYDIFIRYYRICPMAVFAL